MKNKWILKPGEKLLERTHSEDVINYYVSEPQNSGKNLIILTEADIIYFMDVKHDKTMKSADVAMLYQGNYYFLPKDMARGIAEAHMLHMTLLSNAHEFLQAAFD